MEFVPSPKQTLFLWRLLVEPEGAFLAQIKPELTPTERNQLVQAELIAVDKRKATPKARATNHAHATEQGWSWIERHLDAPLPVQGAAANTVLRRLLLLLKPRVEAKTIALADLLLPVVEGSTPPALTVPPAESVESVACRIQEACRQLTGGAPHGVRIRLAELRSLLTDVPRNLLDESLLELERTSAAALYPLNDPREIEPADEAAAIASSSGTPRHILYLSRP